MARTAKSVVTVGMNINAHRTDCGFSKTALAKMIGVTVANICHWENDVAAPRPAKRDMLARLFNCDKAEFERAAA